MRQAVVVKGREYQGNVFDGFGRSGAMTIGAGGQRGSAGVVVRALVAVVAVVVVVAVVSPSERAESKGSSADGGGYILYCPARDAGSLCCKSVTCNVNTPCDGHSSLMPLRLSFPVNPARTLHENPQSHPRALVPDITYDPPPRQLKQPLSQRPLPRADGHPPPYSFFLFFRTVKTVILRSEALPGPSPSFDCFAGRGLSTQTVPYIHETYVSIDAVGSGNGFGEISGAIESLPGLVLWGGVLGETTR